MRSGARYEEPATGGAGRPVWSQMGEWDPTEMITGWAREQGAPRRLAAAEAFHRMVLNKV